MVDDGSPTGAAARERGGGATVSGSVGSGGAGSICSLGIDAEAVTCAEAACG
jgi:hypothetical protein